MLMISLMLLVLVGFYAAFGAYFGFHRGWQFL